MEGLYYLCDVNDQPTLIMTQFDYLLYLTVAIIIHELGHFIFAKKNGVAVHRASLFFNPFFTLLKYDPNAGRIYFVSRKVDMPSKNPGGSGTPCEVALLSIRIHKARAEDVVVGPNGDEFDFTPERVLYNKCVIKTFPEGKVTWRDTQYCLGWIPCGGYVTLRTDASEYGLGSKTPNQRGWINIAGVMFNIITMILALVVIKVLIATGYVDSYAGLAEVIFKLGYLSCVLGLFNILPIPGLDGSYVAISILEQCFPGSRMEGVKALNGCLSFLVFGVIIYTWVFNDSIIGDLLLPFFERVWRFMLMLFGI